MNYHREPRSTLDIDINIFLPPEKRDAAMTLLAATTGAGAVEIERISAAVERDGQARTLWGSTYVDLFFADTDFHRSMASRVEVQPFGNRQAPVLSIEDLLVCKVLFDRPKDWVDIEAVAAHDAGGLDAEYVNLWLLHFLPETDLRFERIGQLLEQYTAS